MSNETKLDSQYEELLAAAGRGDGASDQALFAALYGELHAIAERELRRTQGLAMVSTTTVLHEAYLRLVKHSPVFASKAQYFAYAARAMRSLIIDRARADAAQKRGGGVELVTLSTRDGEAEPRELLAVAEALAELERQEPELADLVDLKYFCGLSVKEIAAMKDVSARTVDRNWQKARLFLHAVMADPT